MILTFFEGQDDEYRVDVPVEFSEVEISAVCESRRIKGAADFRIEAWLSPADDCRCGWDCCCVDWAAWGYDFGSVEGVVTLQSRGGFGMVVASGARLLGWMDRALREELRRLQISFFELHEFRLAVEAAAGEKIRTGSRRVEFDMDEIRECGW